MGQAVQLAGAVLIIMAYLFAQRGQVRYDSVQFLAMNTIGALILAVVAALEGLWGFLLLETVWAWVAGRGLRKAIKANKQAKIDEKKAKISGRRGTRRRPGPNPLRRVE
ncbi:MAG: CBU_0592 family membrane protein [Acidimicrobiia bacterium]